MQIQAKVLTGALALLLSSGAFAQSSGQDDLHAIAKASGLHVRQVQMLLGYASGQVSSHNYEQAERKLRRAVQEGRLQLQLPEWVSAEQTARLGVARSQPVALTSTRDASPRIVATSGD
jgi:predicted outer membrane protein